MKTIIIPISNYGFDPTEVAIPYKILFDNKFKVIFSTPEGKPGEGDRIMLTGKGLGIWKPLLKARKDAVIAYKEMIKTHSFQNPIPYSEINEKDFDAIFLPGGHDKGVKEYLESRKLQSVVLSFFSSNKKIAAICHGVLILARTINPLTNRSVIYKYKTTSLLKSQELLAYHLTKLWLKDYYLTYPNHTVENEVIAALENPENFIRGKFPVLRDSKQHLNYGFFVRDKNYISARWPGDVYSLSYAFIKMLNEID